MHRIAILIVFAAITLGLPAAARAQDSGVLRHQPAPESTASADDQILAAFDKAKKDGEGLVIVGVGIWGLSCAETELFVARVVDGRQQSAKLLGWGRFFGKLTNTRPRGLGAGEWTIGAVRCGSRAGGSGGQIFNGPYAKFTVVAGGIVDAGVLKIEYEGEEYLKRMLTGAATIRLSVAPTPEVRLTDLRQRIPKVMALVKKQPMVITAPTEQKIKYKNSLF